MSKSITNAQILEAINNISKQFDSLSKRVDALEGKSKPSNSSKGKAEKPSTTKGFSTDLKDYEPKKVDGFYNYRKTKKDTIKSRNLVVMRKAYCYAVATNGQAIDSNGCYKLGIEVDFSPNGAYYTAKAEFDKAYPYTKKADR